MRAIYPFLRKYCLVGIQGNHYLQVNETERRVPELSASDRKVILHGQCLSPGWCCHRAVLGTRAPWNESPPFLHPPSLLAHTSCQPYVPLLVCSLLPPATVTAAAQWQTPGAGASPGCLLTAASPAGHAHCFDFLRQIHLMPALHTTALMAVSIPTPHAVPVAKLCVPVGLFNNRTSILLLIVLLTATPRVASVVASVTFMNVVYGVCDRSCKYVLTYHRGWISSVNPKTLHTISPCRLFFPVCHLRFPLSPSDVNG